MPVAAELRSLNIDIPTQPALLLRLAQVLGDPSAGLASVANLIGQDMALAAAVMKAVNSSLYGLRGRVQTVQQAVSHLGTRELLATTFEMGLRAAFPAAEELEPLWVRASQRGAMMSRLAKPLHSDPWLAHSAGLFAECGKAVLYRHAPQTYGPMLVSSTCEHELAQAERHSFGVSHTALGAALCESWGLSHIVASAVRQRLVALTSVVPQQVADLRELCALMTLAHTCVAPGSELRTVILAHCDACGWDADGVLKWLQVAQGQTASSPMSMDTAG